jgi:hypothetical protein
MKMKNIFKYIKFAFAKRYVVTFEGDAVSVCDRKTGKLFNYPQVYAAYGSAEQFGRMKRAIFSAYKERFRAKHNWRYAGTHDDGWAGQYKWKHTCGYTHCDDSRFGRKVPINHCPFCRHEKGTC